MALKPSRFSIRCFATTSFAVLSPAILFFSPDLQAQTVKHLEEQYPALIRKVEFRTFTVKDGLTANNLRGRLLVDTRGYIWISTFDGLNRFDGYKFENFRNNPLDSNSLSGSGVYAICEDRRGIIWLGTKTTGGGEIGLNHFDPNTKQIYRHTSELFDSTVRGVNVINCIYEDWRNVLWIGTTNGLYQVRYQTNSHSTNTAGKQRLAYVKYSHDPKNPASLSNDSVLSIREDAEHALWVRTGKGVDRLDGRTGSIARFREDPRVPEFLVGKLINELYEDRSGVLWICTDEGLYMVQKNSGSLTHFKNTASDHRSLSNNLVNTVHQDMGGTIWVGTAAGLNEFDPVTRKFLRHLPGAIVISIADDRAGNLWIGTNGNGLSQLTKRARELKTFTLAGHASSRLYFANESFNGGLWANPPNNDSIVYLETTGKKAWQLDVPDFQEMLAGKHGELWFAYERGLGLMDKTGAFSSYQLNDGEDGPRANIVNSLCEDSQGYLWVATGQNGLLKFDPNSKTFVKRYRHDPSDSTSINANTVTNIIEDEEHFFWVATPNGLNRLDPLTEKFTHRTHSPTDTTTLSSSLVHCLADGKDGSLWVGTSLGVNRFDKKTGKVQRFFRGNGTLTNYVYQILRDRTGNVWVGYANDGFSKLDVRTGRFTTFTERDGLHNEMFNAWGCMQRQNGEIVLQSGVGSVVFHPDSLRPSAFIPNIVLTAFSVFDKSISLLEDSVSCKTITMPHDSNFFSFEFASLDPTVPERNEHAYKLEGYEENWNYVGNKRDAHYTKVPPGEYVFRVKGTNSDGVWNEKGTFVTITITPPWWRTIWAYVGYGLAIVGVLYTIRRAEKKRDRLKQQAELDRVESEKRLQQEFSRQLIETQEAERKRVASELHDSLGQHLLIVNNEIQLYLQSEERKDADLQRTASVVKDSIKEVREIASNLHPHHLEKLGLRAAVEALIEQISRSTSVKFETVIADVDDKLNMQAKINLYRVLQEAIANIVRHSGATQARITISQTNDSVQTLIEDNGKGFAAGTSQGGRQGFGLKSMTERINLCGGTITFDSSPGKGTTIRIAIPIHS